EMWSGCVRCGNAGRQGVLQHLPNTIQLGAFRGSVFYPGQSKECRKCGSLDHLAAACTMDICRNCKASDHTTAQCPTPVKCNFCSSANHSFKDCPQAHSNRVKLLICLLISEQPTCDVDICSQSGNSIQSHPPDFHRSG
uniref:CCHC-type domain-containing protein n=1 Tax=Sparus aurata TaxID=8175 RepID=A0A671YFU1_SPAAU